MTYFENLVATPENFKLDLIYNAREILLKASEEQRLSSKYFENSREHCDDETYWRLCLAADQKAKGLLTAYKIITGRDVVNGIYSIECEIRWIEDTFELFQ